MSRKEVLGESTRSREAMAESAPRAGRKAFGRGPAPPEMHGPPAPFSDNTLLVVKAACQCLGYYPTRTPSRAEMRCMLRELQRTCGDWKKGIDGMSTAFGDLQQAIAEIHDYARQNGILPK